MWQFARDRTMSACPDGPRINRSPDSRKANDMLPGLNPTDCQVAWVRHQHMVKDGLDEQFKTAHLPAHWSTRTTLNAIRARWNALLIVARRSLPDVRLGASKRIEPATAR